jgi:hypothetical protein
VGGRASFSSDTSVGISSSRRSRYGLNSCAAQHAAHINPRLAKTYPGSRVPASAPPAAVCADQIRVAHLDWTCPVAAGLPFEGKGSVSSRPEPANADDVPVREGIVWEGSDAQNPNAKAGRPERGGWCRKHFQLISALFPSSRDSIFALALSCRSLCR